MNKAGARFRDESETYGHAKKHLEVFHFDSPECLAQSSMVHGLRREDPSARVPSSWSIAPPVGLPSSRTTWRGSFIPGVRQSPRRSKRAGSYAATPSPSSQRAASIDPPGLEQTVARYNGFCRRGVDEEFGRDEKRLTPIDKPPFYALECVVNLINTQGGPRRNAKSQVLDPYGNPIPSLYAVGEFGSDIRIPLSRRLQSSRVHRLRHPRRTKRR